MTGLFKALTVMALCAVMLVAPACNFSTGLQEAGTFIAEAKPFVDLVPAFVCPFSTNACADVTRAQQIADPAMSVVSKTFTDWSAASTAAQPGLLGQLTAAIQTAQQDQAAVISAARVENPAAQTKLNGIASSLEASMSDLLTLLQQAKAGGGTTAALAKVLEDATPEYETYSSVPALLIANPLRVFSSPNTLKLKSGQKIHTYHYHKCKIMWVLSEKSGDKNVDAIAKAKLAVLKKL